MAIITSFSRGHGMALFLVLFNRCRVPSLPLALGLSWRNFQKFLNQGATWSNGSTHFQMKLSNPSIRCSLSKLDFIHSGGVWCSPLTAKILCSMRSRYLLLGARLKLVHISCPNNHLPSSFRLAISLSWIPRDGRTLSSGLGLGCWLNGRHPFRGAIFLKKKRDFPGPSGGKLVSIWDLLLVPPHPVS